MGRVVSYALLFQVGFWVFNVLFCSLSLAEERANLDWKKVALSAGWQKLLHYKQGFWGSLRSELDGKGFFFAEDGKTNPLSELKASYEAMGKDLQRGKLKLHPQCAFPERYRFLKMNLGLKVKEASCPEFDEFMERFHEPVGVSVVFSSAYPNNPASMFGHTLLKIHSKKNSDLLHGGISFAAQVPPDDGSLVFFWRGVSGGYPGVWSNQPYYVKVQDYVNFESRDLWEYELAFTEEETRRLLAHIWEIEMNSHFEYFFFDENCSYQLLAVLEAIRPEWNLLRHRIYMIPGESIKFLMDTPGVVRKVHYRPSLSKKVRHHSEALNNKESILFDKLVQGTLNAEEVRSRPVLDAYLSYLDYLRNEKPKIYKDEYKSVHDSTRSHRARQGTLTDIEREALGKVQGETRPDWGHDSFAVSLAGGLQTLGDQSRPTTSLNIKSAYHDLLNKDLGYTRFAHIDFPSLELKYLPEQHHWQLQNLTLLATTSLPPWIYYDPRWSWKFRMAWQRPLRSFCLDCQEFNFGGGAGVSWTPLGPRHRVYSMVLVQTRIDTRKWEGYGVGPGVELGSLWTLSSNYKAYIRLTQHWVLGQHGKWVSEPEAEISHSFSFNRNWELRQQNRLFWQMAGPAVGEFDLRLIHFFR